MDLYGDLPPTQASIGESKASGGSKEKNESIGSSVWKSTPLMIPSAMKPNVSTTATSSTVVPKKPVSSLSFIPSSAPVKRPSESVATSDATPTTNSTVSFLPSSLTAKHEPNKSPLTMHSTTSTTSITAKKKTSGLVAFAFTPVSVIRKTGIGSNSSTSTVITDAKKAQVLGSEEGTSASAEVGDVFVQAVYRDEYDPSRPNSYEVFCHERKTKEKMKQVKKDIEKRQRKQDEKDQEERKKLMKDLESGKAPKNLQVPSASAGRGRGMTMPAWMMKKIQETNEKGGPTPVEPVGSRPVEPDQFEDAPVRGGLGFSKAQTQHEPPPPTNLYATFQKPQQQDLPSAHKAISSHDHNRQPTNKITTHHQRRSRSRNRRERTSSRSRSHSRSRSRSQGRHRDRDHRRDRNDRRALDRQGDFGRSRKETGSSRQSRWTSNSAASSVVLLQNMVGPGEVDAELQDEVKEECSSKYGPVNKCVIYELPPGSRPEEAVRIFVEFKYPEQAQKAIGGLNGRFFGGRQVKASLYDHHRYQRLDLTA